MMLTFRDKSSEELLAASDTHAREASSLFAGGIAHDLRNRLFSIMGYAELVKKHLAGSDHTTTVSQ